MAVKRTNSGGAPGERFQLQRIRVMLRGLVPSYEQLG
jgi:hypothetical protein